MWAVSDVGRACESVFPEPVLVKYVWVRLESFIVSEWTLSDVARNQKVAFSEPMLLS
jgi:hypothetical protein